MMKILFTNQRKLFFNSVRSQSKKNYIGYILSFLIAAFLLFYVSKGIWAIGDTITDAVLAGITSYGLLMIIGAIILLGLPQVFKHLYSATDLGLLFTLPIPTRSIFWIKYFQSFMGIPLLAFILFFIPLVIYGLATGVNFLYYPVLIFVLLAASIIGLSIAYLFNLILIQVVPKNKANEFMTIMSVLSGLFVYLMFMIPNLTSEKPITEVMLSGLPLFPDWVPISWGSTALIEAKIGSIDFLLPLVLLLILAIFSIILTSSLVEKGFRTGWIRLSEGGSKKRKKSRKKDTQLTLHHPAIAIGKKEWYSIKRDMREWLVFLPLVFFIVFPLIGFFGSGAKISDLQGHSDISWPIAQGAFLFIYAVFNGTLAANSVAREGTSAWIMRTLPLSGRNIAVGKLWISWLLPFILLTVIECIAGIVLGWSILQFLAGVLLKAVISLGCSAIGLWLGTMGAKYNPSNPQQRLKFGTSLLLLVSTYIYLIIALIPYVLLIVPVKAADVLAKANDEVDGFFGMLTGIGHDLLTWKGDFPLLAEIIGILAILIISLGVASIFIKASARKFDKGIEIEMVQNSNAKSLFGRKKSGGSLY